MPHLCTVRPVNEQFVILCQLRTCFFALHQYSSQFLRMSFPQTWLYWHWELLLYHNRIFRIRTYSNRVLVWAAPVLNPTSTHVLFLGEWI